jgi:hypothetical protein
MGYSQIVALMNLPIISVLIYNLSQSPPARVELSKVGVVPRIIKKLGDGKMDSCKYNSFLFFTTYDSEKTYYYKKNKSRNTLGQVSQIK